MSQDLHFAARQTFPQCGAIVLALILSHPASAQSPRTESGQTVAPRAPEATGPLRRSGSPWRNQEALSVEAGATVTPRESRDPPAQRVELAPRAPAYAVPRARRSDTVVAGPTYPARRRDDHDYYHHGRNAPPDYDPVPSSYFVCSSLEHQFKRCSWPRGAGEVRITEQLSGAACLQGRDWGIEHGAVWVHNGCRARFEAW